MLFDLEDYRAWGIIGPDNKPANQINWVNPHTTFRATRDAYLKAVNEYFLSAQVLCTPEEAQTLNVKQLELLESNLVLGPLSKQFWHAMVSLPLAGQLNVGDRFDVLDVNKNAQDSSYMVYPDVSPTQPNWVENYKSVAVSNPEGEYKFTEMSQEFYNDYKAAFADFQSKMKELIIVSEGGVANFNDYVAPAVPVWDSYPELSGYVRGTNNLTIKDAVVRLIDGDGASHDLVTDEHGYYKFDKEMFYNNIAFDHTAIESNFKMLLLENVVGSTASLYDKTSKFENSFWGAENNREVNWEISVKMGKPARKNFKIEVIEDYSMYPSIKGQVLDQDGNPVKGALMGLYYYAKNRWLDEKYNKNTGSWKSGSKFSEFGEEKTLLTDENGMYEYSSQYIGDWFKNNILVEDPNFTTDLNESPFNVINGSTLDSDFLFRDGNDTKGFDNYWNGYVNAVFEQNDGKILVSGNFTANGVSFDGQQIGDIIRINSDGTLDTSFDTYGLFWHPSQSWVSDMVVDHEILGGKIIVVGRFFTYGYYESNEAPEAYNIVRLNSDGSIDETFNCVFNDIFSSDIQTHNGVDYSSLRDYNSWGSSERTPSVTIREMEVDKVKLHDGKILIFGPFYTPTVNLLGMLRLNLDGTIDTTLNGLSELPSQILSNKAEVDAKNVECKELSLNRISLQEAYDVLSSPYDLVVSDKNSAYDYLQTLTEGTPEYNAALEDYQIKLTAYDTLEAQLNLSKQSIDDAETLFKQKSAELSLLMEASYFTSVEIEALLVDKAAKLVELDSMKSDLQLIEDSINAKYNEISTKQADLEVSNSDYQAAVADYDAQSSACVELTQFCEDSVSALAIVSDYLSTLVEGTEEHTAALADYDSKVAVRDSYYNQLAAARAAKTAAQDQMDSKNLELNTKQTELDFLDSEVSTIKLNLNNQYDIYKSKDYSIGLIIAEFDNFQSLNNYYNPTELSPVTFAVGLTNVWANPSQRSGFINAFTRIIGVDILASGKVLVSGHLLEFKSKPCFDSQWNADYSGNVGLLRLDLSTNQFSEVYDDTFLVSDKFFQQVSRSGNSVEIMGAKETEEGKLIVFGNFNYFESYEFSSQHYGLISLNEDGTYDEEGSSKLINQRNVSINDVVLLSNGNKLVCTSDGSYTILPNGELIPLHEERNNNIEGVANGNVRKAIELSDESILIFGQFSGYYSTMVDTYNLQGICKVKFGPINVSKKELILDSVSFDNFYTNTSLSYNGGPFEYGHSISSHDFRVVLYPYLQDEISGTVVKPWDNGHDWSQTPKSSKIYDYNDWFDSNFDYSYNERNEIYINTVLPGVNIFNVREKMVDPELGAEKAYFTGYRNNQSGLYLTLETNTGYYRVVFANGTKQIMSSGNQITMPTEFDNGDVDYVGYYVYSCNNIGGASGKITSLNIQGHHDMDLSELSGLSSINMNSNSKVVELDLRKSKNTLNYIYFNTCYAITTLDLTDCNVVNNITFNECTSLKLVRGFNRIENLSQVNISNSPINSKRDLIPGETQYDFDKSFKRGNDNTFWVDGSTRDVLELPDGSLIIAGEFNWTYYYNDQGNQTQMYTKNIVKIKADKTIDENFINNISNGPNSSIRRLALTSTGKIMVFGEFNNWKNATCGGVVRLSTSGVLDKSFIAKTKASDGSYIGWVRDYIALADDQYILVGNCQFNLDNNGNNTLKGLVKMKSDGSIDKTWKFRTDNDVYCATLMGDYIFIGGDFNNTWNFNNTQLNLNTSNSIWVFSGRVAKVKLSDAIADPTFCSNIGNGNIGGGFNSAVFSLLVDNDKLIVAGAFDQFKGSSISKVARFNLDGTLDLTWVPNNSTSTFYVNSNVEYLFKDENGYIYSYGSFNQLNGVDLGQAKFVGFDSLGNIISTTPSTGYVDYYTYRIVTTETHRYICGYFWTYTSVSGDQTSCSYFAPLYKAPKYDSMLKFPANVNYMYVSSVNSKMDFSACTNLGNQLNINNCQQVVEVDLSNVQFCNGLYLDNLGKLTILKFPISGVSQLQINNCTRLDLSTLDLSKVMNYLRLYTLDLKGLDLVINSSQINSLNLGNLRNVNNFNLNMSNLGELSLDNFTPNGNSTYNIPNVRNLNLYSMVVLPDFSQFTKITNLNINSCNSISTINLSMNLLTYLNINSCQNLDSLTINCPNLQTSNFNGFQRQPTTLSINAPNVVNLQFQSHQYNSFNPAVWTNSTKIDQLQINSMQARNNIDISSFGSVRYLYISWVYYVKSITFPETMPNLIRFEFGYNGYTSETSNDQRTAMGKAMFKAASTTTKSNGYWTMGQANGHRWYFDSEAQGYRTILQNKSWNGWGEFSN